VSAADTGGPEASVASRSAGGDGLAGVAATGVSRSAADRLAALRAYARHIVLFSLAAGLALGPVSRAGTVAAAGVAGVVAGRRSLAVGAVAAVLVGAVLADARLAALDRGGLPSMHGERWAGRAVLLEPVRQRGPRRAVARVRLRGLDEVAVARMRRRRRWPGVGAIVDLAGAVAPLGEYDRYQRRRGALATLEVDRFATTGETRAGLSGVLDRVRRRAELGLERGLPPPEAALLRGMVLGQDERLSERVRTEFERSGLAHLLSVRP
jgi:competence protein ComEC